MRHSFMKIITYYRLLTTRIGYIVGRGEQSSSEELLVFLVGITATTHQLSKFPSMLDGQRGRSYLLIEMFWIRYPAMPWNYFLMENYSTVCTLGICVF
jgi:hypothetical protein